MNKYKPRRSLLNKKPNQPHTAQRGSPHHSKVNPEAPLLETSRPSRGRPPGRSSPYRSGAQSSLKNDEKYTPRPIPYKFLEEMVNDESITPSDLANRLATESSGFYVTLRQDLREGMTQMLLKVLAKICKDEVPNQSVNFVLKNALECNFHEKASTFLHSITDENRQRRDVGATHVANCLYLMKAWMTKMPTSSRKQVSMLNLIITNAVGKLDIQSHEAVHQVFTEVQQIVNEIKSTPVKNIKEKQQEKENLFLSAMHQENPPDDFRKIPVFPRQSDINATTNPFVRTNLVSKAYENQDHYLDVQYRLLREDFVRPLREGIREYLVTDTLMHKKNTRVQNIKVYNKVKIEYPFPGPRGMLYCIHFDPNPLRGVRWQSSKRLMFGNLICLSCDKFKNNLLFATVAQRDPEKLSFGFLNVEFVHSTSVIEISAAQTTKDPSSEDEEIIDLEDEVDPLFGETFVVPDVDMQQEYTMVETEAYFEAYRHVLAGLQEIDIIPLERYLLRCQSTVQPPQYLRNNPEKNSFLFSAVFDTLPPTKGVVDILNENSWPSAEELSLDNSQKEALVNALTREMSIIQGPPGTGKTYIGLIIMKLLLANNFTHHEQPRRNHRQQERKNPILVVCYTNHALDQFLEEIAQFQKNGIVRVGGRCKNKNLENYTLMKVKRSGNFATKFNRRTVWNYRDEMKYLSQKMTKSIEILEASTTVLLNLETIQHVIPVHLYNQFDCQPGKPANDAFMEWLGVISLEQDKLDKEFITFQTLGVVVNHFQHIFPNQFHVQQIYDAIIHTSSFDFQTLLSWMTHFPSFLHSSSQPSLPPTDLILKILSSMPLQPHSKSLLELGYNKEEINCAIFVTGNRNPKLWLERNSSTNDFTTPPLQNLDINESESNEELEVEEEAALVQEQRMSDEEMAMKTLQNDNLEEKEKKKKSLIKDISAATFDSIEGDHDPDGEGWQVQKGEKKRRKQQLKKEIVKTDAMSSESAKYLTDVHKLAPKKRWMLYRRWVADFRKKLREDVDKHIVQYNRIAKSLHQLQRLEDQSVLEQADVIGITTTGAAKYRDIIHKLPVKIVIVEEAAEVLEAHIVTSMPASTEHLILIGDHQQLKPSPTVFELAVKYNLDVSLFERMIKNGSPYTRLRIQHRMRPKIADLLRIDIYSDLVDHSSVKMYDEIRGVQKNVFFISHEQLEQSVSDGRSKVNQHEADYMVALCQYLLCQGYKPEQITILTAYTGQLFAFKRIMKRKLHQGVRVTAVDNFQGEENDIILLSLVRSNEQESIGFLKIENRVCVALSRAKMGLFCIGNFTILQKKSELWRRIVDKLKIHGQFGTSMPLQCQNHPDYITNAAVAMDFTKVPEGGCGKPCEFRRQCGHRCTRTCHPDDEEHTKYKCRKPCPKKCPQGHKCRLQCHQACGNCKVPVTKTIPTCYHQQEVPCYQDPATFECKMPCSEILDCDHKCAGICGGPCTKQCMTLVTVDSPCGHEIKVPCHSSTSPDKSRCKEKCNVMLKCEHYCKGTCVSCFQGRIHDRCKQKCDRPLICGHTCLVTCAQNCPPCTKKCTTRCEHSKCQKKCSEPCQPCVEKCGWKCQHYTCTKLCSEPCDRPPCNRPCPELKKCGHPCIGLCGEPCPKLCRVCDKDKVTEIFFGDEDEKDARFVQLEDCNHIFTYQGLDTWINQDNDKENDSMGIALKECPRCKTAIKKSRRYGNIVNKQLESINQVKIKIAGNAHDVSTKRLGMLREVQTDKYIGRYYKNEHDILIDELHEKRSKTTTDIHVAEVKFRGLSRLAEFQNKLNVRKSLPITYSSSTGLWKEFEASCRQISAWLMKKRNNFSDQETDDLERELMRLKQCVVFLKIKPSISKGRDNTDKLEQMLFRDFSPYSQDKQEKVEKYMKDIKIQNPMLFSGLGISEEERSMIVTAMSLSKGHWYKCRNGHVYAIGECGGATQRSRCPECKENIGGVSHRLAEGNQLAGEMDGATIPAFDPLNMNIPAEFLQDRFF